MALSLPTNLATVQAWVGALYGYAVGSTTMANINSDITSYGGLNNTLNAYYTSAFGSQTTAAVAKTIVANVGLGTDADAITYVTGILTSAAPAARGVAVQGILSAFAGLTADKTYGAAASAWTTTVSNAVSYEQANAADATLAVAATTVAAAAAAAATAGTAYTLTTGVDSFTGTAGNDTFTAADGTFSALDALIGNGGADVLNITNTTAAFSTPSGATVTNIPTINLYSASFGATFDISSNYSGTTQLNANITTPAAGSTITLGSKASGTVTVATAGGFATTVYGGVNDLVTVTGSTTADAVTVGSTTKLPLGTVTVNLTEANVTTGGTITTVGGTTVAINSKMTATSTSTYTQGAVSVTGSAATTTVTVAQTADSKYIASASNATSTAAAITAQGGVKMAAVKISDVNATTATTASNTISTVTLTNAASSTISSNALTTLNLNGVFTNVGASAGAVITITNAAAAAATNTTLNLGLAVTSLSSTYNNYSTDKPTITDTNYEITTINAVMSASSSLKTIIDTALTTLNISGSGVLTFTTVPTSLKTITLAGAGGLSGTISSTAVTSIDASSSTAIQTISLNPAGQSFKGGSGQDVITITVDATKAITGGTATNNELVLNAPAATFTAANTVANATGFTILGTNTGSSGTYDLSVLTGFKTIDVQDTATVKFTNVPVSTNLLIDKSATSVTVNLADSNGTTDSYTATVGKNSSTVHEITVVTLAFDDYAGNGIGTLNLISTGYSSTVGSKNTINTLTDAGLSTLNLSGGYGLLVSNAVTPTSTAVTINNVSTSIVSPNLSMSLADNSLTQLNLSGSASTTIGTLTDSAPTISIADTSSAAQIITTATVSSATTLNVTNSAGGALSIPTLTDTAVTTEKITNSGAGSLVIGATAHAGAALTSLTYSGNVTDTVTAISGTSTIKVSGTTNNSPVSLTFSGVTAAGKTVTVALGDGSDTVTFSAASVGTHNVTLGNGNNTFSETATVAGAINLTVGSGANTVTIGTAASNTYGYSTFTAAAHSGVDSVSIGAAGTAYFNNTPTLVWTGAQTNDTLTFLNDSHVLTVNTVTPGPSLSSTIALLEAGATANNVYYAVYGGNTYVVESSATASPSGSNTTFVEIIGSHTFTAGTTGIIVIAT